MSVLILNFQLQVMLTVLYQALGSEQNSHTTHLLRIRKDDAIMKNITYRQVGDFNIPNLILPPEEANITLGKWGMLHKDYLLKHKKVVFATLLAEGKLYQHCAEVENQAQNMFDALVKQLKDTEGVTEQLKENNQMLWVQEMNNIQNRVTEIIKNKLIYK